MKLTGKNYYNKEANVAFMSVSQFKDFRKCEAMAMAKLKGEYKMPPIKALLLGSFVDEMLTGTKKSKMEFILGNREELFQKSSKLLKYSDEEFAKLLADKSFDPFQVEHKP